MLKIKLAKGYKNHPLFKQNQTKKMKKITFLIAMLSITFYSVNAQQIPNGSFENWTGDSASSWVTKFSLFGTPLTLANKSTTFQDGQFALEALSQTVPIMNITIPGIATLGKISVDIANVTAVFSSGVPFTDKPLRMKGWYQYNRQGTDSAIAIVLLTKWNPITSKSDTVGIGGFIHTASQATYAQFTVDITYQNQTAIPDTLNIILLSSGRAATAGSKFTVDNLAFEYDQSILSNNKLDCYIYPNPSNGLINVSLASNEKTTATLYNSLGQKMFSKALYTFSSTLDFSNLPKGIYLLELKSDELRTVKKITLK